MLMLATKQMRYQLFQKLLKTWILLEHSSPLMQWDARAAIANAIRVKEG
jgi:hypothetical protein